MFPALLPSYAVMAMVLMGSDEDHPEIVPPSPAKIKALGAVMPLWVIWKSWLALKTIPVGLAEPPRPAGMETTKDCGTPLPSYRVDFDVPLSATQAKAVGLNARPQPFFRLVSVWVAATPPSET